MIRKSLWQLWVLKSPSGGLCSSLACPGSAQRHLNTSRIDKKLAHIAKLLGCKMDELNKTSLPPNLLQSCPIIAIDQSHQLLVRKNFNKQLLQRNPWLLLNSVSDLNSKLDLLSNSMEVTAETVPLLQLTVSRLAQAIKGSRGAASAEFDQNRLQFLTHHLQCTVDELLTKFYKHIYLVTLDFDKLSRITCVLLEAGILPSNILSDLWVYEQSERVMHERIRRATSAGVHPIKTWMLRSTESNFVKLLKKTTDARAVLGTHENSISYLAERLQCSEEEVIELQKRHQRLQTTNLPKIKKVLDFLYANGFTSEEITCTTRVFGSSLDTLQSRLKLLRDMGYSKKNLHLLCTTRKIFEKFVKKSASVEDKRKAFDHV